MVCITVNTDVDVDIDMSELDTDDLCDELENRGLKVFGNSTYDPTDITTSDGEQLGGDIEELYYAYVLKRPTFDKLLVDFFDKSIGRIA